MLKNPSLKLARVLAGIDFSPASVEAARWAACHFAPDGELILLHAIDSPAPPSFLRRLMPPHEELVETARRGALERLAGIGAWSEDPQVVREVVVGPPAEAIVRSADLHGADVVVIGEHGRPHGTSVRLGTTAERVLTESSAPVLLARGLPPAAPRTILVAFDGSEPARHALRWGAFLAARFVARIIVLHVVTPVFVPADPVGFHPLVFDPAMAQEAAVEWVRLQMEKEGLPPEIVRSVIGDPAHEILATAAREDADLIVMGSRGGTGIVAGLLGGVTRAILRRGEAATLVIGPLAART